MTDKEAMKLALFALDIVKIHFTQSRHINEAITALKERLAQQEQEQQIKTLKRRLFEMQEAAKDLAERVRPLTPPQRTWVDLSDTQIERVYFDVVKEHRGAPMPWGQVQFGRALLNKFKEKNNGQ